MASASITKPFIIQVDDKFVLNPSKDNQEDIVQTRVGDRDDAAVFTLSDGYLTSGDLFMGRHIVEPPAPFIPAFIFWMKHRQGVQQVQKYGSEQEPRLITNGLWPKCRLLG